MAEDITQETVDIIVPVVTLDPATATPRLPVAVRHFIVFDYAESPRQRRRRSVCLRKMRHVQVGADRGEQGLSLGPDNRGRKKSVSAK